MTVKLITLSQMSLAKGIHFFLFDSNTINKSMLDFFSENHLHVNEINTLHQRKKTQAKQEFIISRMLIKQLFNAKCCNALHQIEIKFNEESSLLEVFYLDKRQPFSISLSHSKGLIFLAVSRSNISFGVDIEKRNTKRDFSLLAKNFFHVNEVEQIEQRGAEAFYRIWTLKEAISKHFKQAIVTTLKQNIFEQLPILTYKSGIYNDFDLSFVCDITEHSSIKNSIYLFEPQTFLNLFIDTTHADLKTSNAKIKVYQNHPI